MQVTIQTGQKSWDNKLNYSGIRSISVIETKDEIMVDCVARNGDMFTVHDVVSALADGEVLVNREK